GDRVRKTKLGVVIILRRAFGRDGLTHDRYLACGDEAFDFVNRLCADATFLAQCRGTVDERVIEVATRVGLEPNVQKLPALPQGRGERCGIPVAAAQMATVETEASVEGAARPGESGGGESRRDQTSMRRPAGMNAFRPGTVGEEFERPCGLAARQPERVGE